MFCDIWGGVEEEASDVVMLGKGCREQRRKKLYCDVRVGVGGGGGGRRMLHCDLGKEMRGVERRGGGGISSILAGKDIVL